MSDRRNGNVPRDSSFPDDFRGSDRFFETAIFLATFLFLEASVFPATAASLMSFFLLAERSMGPQPILCRAAPLCIAMCSVLSLLISYCGSSALAWCV